MNRAEEQEITKLMMGLYGFRETKSGKSVSCIYCGRKFAKNYVGKHLNERMIEHYEIFHEKK